MTTSESASEAVLSCRGLTAGYGEVAVVRELDLDVPKGEVVLMLGANGAGKTTTLMTLAGALPRLGGTISFAGCRDKAKLSERARSGMAFVPEERSVFRTLSCRDNLRLGEGDAVRALEHFPELKRRESVSGGLLSGGEQQMLSLGRALSMEPRLLLADELSLGLAPLIVDKLLAAIRAAADAGCAVLLVEQHVRKALTIADRVVVLRRGRVVMSGTAEGAIDRLGEIEDNYLSQAV
ncbi:MAG: ATP-binding cassette domain-containing protein [Solirubrobacterales bacterium]